MLGRRGAGLELDHAFVPRMLQKAPFPLALSNLGPDASAPKRYMVAWTSNIGAWNILVFFWLSFGTLWVVSVVFRMLMLKA